MNMLAGLYSLTACQATGADETTITRRGETYSRAGRKAGRGEETVRVFVFLHPRGSGFLPRKLVQTSVRVRDAPAVGTSKLKTKAQRGSFAREGGERVTREGR